MLDISTILSTFSNYMKIMLDPDKLTWNMDRADIHVPIILTDQNFDFSKIRSDGNDIAFVDSKWANVFPHEIEYIDTTNQYAIIWVKVNAFIVKKHPVVFFLFYGNSNQTTPAQDVLNTWTDYIGVWHFNINTTLGDGSVINNDIWESIKTYPNGPPVKQDNLGPFSGSCYGFVGNKYIRYSPNSIFNIIGEFTVESCAYVIDENVVNTWLGTRDACERTFDIKFNKLSGIKHFHYDIGNCSNWMDLSQNDYDYLENVWYGVGLTTRIYEVYTQVNTTAWDGVSISSQPVFACSGCYMRIGSGGYGTEHLEGFLDELRICSKFKPKDNLFYETLLLSDPSVVIYDQNVIDHILDRYQLISTNF